MYSTGQITISQYIQHWTNNSFIVEQLRNTKKQFLSICNKGDPSPSLWNSATAVSVHNSDFL